MSKKAELLSKMIDEAEELSTDNLPEIDDELQQYSAKHLHQQILEAKKDLTQKCGSLLLQKVFEIFHKLLVSGSKLNSNIWSYDYVGCPIEAIKQDLSTSLFDIELSEDLKFISAEEFKKRIESNYLMDLVDVAKTNPKTFNIAFEFTPATAISVFEFLSNYGYIVKWDAADKQVYAYILMSEFEENNDESQAN